MHRFFISKPVKLEDRVVIIDAENDVNHIVRALRVTVGEKLEVCDINGKEFVVEVDKMDEVVSTTIIRENLVSRESHLKIDLYQGLAKGSKMETIIQKSVELGVHKIVPLMTKRAIVKLDDKSASKKIDRWQKIADEAGKQSKRSMIPIVEKILHIKNFKDVVSEYDLVLVAYELESDGHLKQVLKSTNAQKVAILIGPEGGFDSDEIDNLLTLGVKSISLGPRILRTETAGPMLLSILQYELGDVSI